MNEPEVTTTATENVTLASNEGKQEQKKDEYVSKKEYDTVNGRYGSALQQIQKLQEQLLEVEKIKQTLSEKEKLIEKLSIYQQKHNERIQQEWNTIKPQITEELKEMFPEADKEDVPIETIENFISKWNEIQKIKNLITKEKKPVPPVTHNVPKHITSGASNWRIG